MVKKRWSYLSQGTIKRLFKAKTNKWMIAIKEELASLEKNNTWILLKKLKNQRVVGCKWIFKVKKGIFGKEKERYNARLVAKVFTQVEEGGFP